MKRIALIATVLIAGCGSGSGYGGGGGSSSQPTSSGGAVATKSAGIGTVLVDGSGRTLYMFSKDSGGKSSCSGACAAAWPPSTGSAKASGGVDKSKLTTTKRSDGKTQLVYAGHPLYRFSGDAAPGDTKGQGLDEFGGKWTAVSASGGAVTSQASSGGGSSGGSSGGGSGGGGGRSYGGY